jgi:hypothetical protein
VTIYVTKTKIRATQNPKAPSFQRENKLGN